MSILEQVDIQKIVSIVKEAGREILKIYKTDFDVAYKGDKSPITKADEKSHDFIVEKLAELYSTIPILSEEAQ